MACRMVCDAVEDEPERVNAHDAASQDARGVPMNASSWLGAGQATAARASPAAARGEEATLLELVVMGVDEVADDTECTSTVWR